MSKFANSLNTMEIESWVPQAMNNPIPHLFGRTDASRGSSGDITPVNGSTKPCEIAVWVLLVMGVLTVITFGRSDAPISVSVEETIFRTRRFVSREKRLRGSGGGPSLDIFRELGFGRDDAKVQG